MARSKAFTRLAGRDTMSASRFSNAVRARKLAFAASGGGTDAGSDMSASTVVGLG
jgi:hypothetical protein